MLYHQTTTNQTILKELKTIPYYKYELMTPNKGIFNMAKNYVYLAVYLKT